MPDDDSFKATWSSDAADFLPRQRRETLTAVRWLLTALCACLMVGRPDSASLLAPLLLLAIFLGRRRRQPCALEEAAASVDPWPRRPVTLH